MKDPETKEELCKRCKIGYVGITVLNNDGLCFPCETELRKIKFDSAPPETSSWEEEFEIFTQDYEDIFNQYVCCNGGIKGDVDCACNGLEWKDKIKDFIRSVASSEYKRGAKKIVAYVKDCHANGFEMQTVVEHLENGYILEGILK